MTYRLEIYKSLDSVKNRLATLLYSLQISEGVIAINVYLDQVHFNFLDAQIGDPIIENVSNITKIHEISNIILYDDFSSYLRPPPNMMELLRHVRINPAKFIGRVIGADSFMCSETHKRILTFKFEGGKHNPYRQRKVHNSGIGRLMKQLDKTRKLDNCYFVDGYGFPERYKGADYLIGLDLTYPEEFRKLFLEDPKLFEKEMKACLKEMMKKLEKLWGGKMFLWANYHIWKSEKPIECHPHIHTNFLNIVKTDKGFKRFSAYLNEDIMRELWRDVLKKRFGYKKEEIDVFSQYIKLTHKADLRHRLKYCSRSPTEDFFNYYAEWEFEKGGIDKDFVKYVLTKYKNRRSAYGCAWNMKQHIGEIEEMRECPCDTGKLVHEGVISLSELKHEIKKFDFLIMYLRDKRIAIYPIIKEGIT